MDDLNKIFRLDIYYSVTYSTRYIRTKSIVVLLKYVYTCYRFKKNKIFFTSRDTTNLWFAHGDDSNAI